ncbi:hypothetical protein RB653_006231 [Dictyostelium firmibasis]|uniref:PPPDE domain-containing protein n=1 Tax=Dictyostelium firmibasis TaxID=79012 RepID=A0AAN7Z1U9_9MYCE
MNLKSNIRGPNISKVYLNIYDLHPINNIGHCLGVGLFHSAVEINGNEIGFSGHEWSFSGVYEIKPKTATGVVFRESLYMGDITLSERQLQSIIDNISEDFPGKSYHPLKKNCNTFSNEFIKRLLNKEIPNYVNRLAFIGTFFSCLLPKSFGFIPQEPVSNSVDSKGKGSNSGGNNIIPFSGKGHSLSGDNDGPKPIYIPDVSYNKDGSNRLNFYGSDNDTSSSSSNSGGSGDSSNGNSPNLSNKNDEEERRKRILIAANNRYMQNNNIENNNINTNTNLESSPSNTNPEFSSDSSSSGTPPTLSDSLSPTISSPLISGK